MSDLECPYCGVEHDIDHDDGFGYEEDERHEMECRHCEKTFVFTTYKNFTYTPSKADCLNGSDHDLKLSYTYPKWCTKMICKDCDYSRKLTDKERFDLGNDYAIPDQYKMRAQ